MRLLRCDRHPDVEARFTFKIQEHRYLTDDERWASLSGANARRFEGEWSTDLCADCADELRAHLAPRVPLPNPSLRSLGA